MSRWVEKPIGYHVVYDDSDQDWMVLNRNSYVVARCNGRDMAKRIAKLLDEDAARR